MGSPAAQAARELVATWYALQRQGWEAHHCQHGTTCVESLNAGGLDEIDRAALAQDIAQAIEQARREEREACALLHQDIDPRCDHEGEHPGAGAMGAVIRYRDAIRACAQEQP